MQVSTPKTPAVADHGVEVEVSYDSLVSPAFAGIETESPRANLRQQ
jgi:hypothetical protein